MNKVYLNFCFPVAKEFLAGWTAERLPEIFVFYSLDRSANVEVTGHQYDQAIRKFIPDWEGLKDEMFKAARNNSEGYKWPVSARGRRMKQFGDDPYNDIHDQWKNEIKERIG